MTLITENGWPQIPASMLDRGPIPGTRAVVELRAGDVSTVLKGWAAWYHRNVEPVDAGRRDEWGWSPTNSVWNSNHLSGTAIDINATRYPWKHYTMPADKVAKVRHGLDLFEGTVFWGRDWGQMNSWPDEMHYQINCGARELAKFAAKLRAGHLGIYAPEVDEMTDEERQMLREMWEQLRGPQGQGWPQLGQNADGQNLTLVDAVADLRTRLMKGGTAK
ncbi:M15 family metallopeptidase [Nocardia otitidiscaviarum]|uniref:M15 family metallopeptidase n=1 Tax=Nocardia otitidiscaviarum TaxID=1823 RepID=UPI0006943B96|nr:M15 family metallopeptidase [Nocardia otitidiscaviarum]MBF6483850.1 M15 family metallopeptidase [Nocardia otitidiscaviarum]